MGQALVEVLGAQGQDFVHRKGYERCHSESECAEGRPASRHALARGIVGAIITDRSPVGVRQQMENDPRHITLVEATTRLIRRASSPMFRGTAQYMISTRSSRAVDQLGFLSPLIPGPPKRDASRKFLSISKDTVLSS